MSDDRTFDEYLRDTLTERFDRALGTQRFDRAPDALDALADAGRGGRIPVDNHSQDPGLSVLSL